MNNITFKQFIYTYNFRSYDDSKRSDDDKYNTTIIRIFPPSENFNRASEWFEFGIYDFSSKEYTLENCEKVLSKEIVNSYVESISYNEEFDNVVTIYLTKEQHYIS